MEIKILTYNLGMYRLLCFGHKYLHERTNALIENFSKNHHHYDILCFQEIFREPIREKLGAGLSDFYPYLVEKIEADNLFEQDSGLFFASKIELLDISKPHFIRFPLRFSKSWDYNSKKGIFGKCLHIKEKTKRGKFLWIFNTHLQSEEGERYQKTRQIQLGIIVNFIKHNIQNQINHGVKSSDISAILVGDMNIIGDNTNEYRNMMKFFDNPLNLYPHVNEDPGYTANYKTNKYLSLIDKKSQELERLDYILSFNHVPKGDDNNKLHKLRDITCKLVEWRGALVNEELKNLDVSDHYGIQASFKI